MWRNGRRNGLKIRSCESGVWVRIPSSAPSKTRFNEGKSTHLIKSVVVQPRARKSTKTHSICQVFANQEASSLPEPRKTTRRIVADNLSRAGWSWGCVLAVDSNGRTIFVADAHRAATVKDRHTGGQICSDKVLISREKVL
jgi:hypothetical protein